MTDKELLEAAARAAGMHEWRFTGSSMSRMIDRARAGSGSIGPNWNPLTDDGDALRLAVKLRLMVNGVGKVVLDGVHVQSDDGVAMECSGEGQDPYAATRRAIVRAAASIGQSGQAQGDGK